MSKKIAKRSLALGALMAFVITGSAMAREVTFDKCVYVHNDYASKYTYPEFNELISANDIDGITINNTSGDGIVAHYMTVKQADGTSEKKYVNIDKPNTDLTINASANGIYVISDCNINVKDLYINAGKNAIEGDGSSDATISAKNIIIDAGARGIFVQQSNEAIPKVTVSVTESLSIDSEEHGLRVGGGEIDINATEAIVQVTSAENAVKTGSGKVDVEAYAFTANGDVAVEGTGSINLNAVTDMVVNGAITTAVGGETELHFKNLDWTVEKQSNVTTLDGTNANIVLATVEEGLVEIGTDNTEKLTVSADAGLLTGDNAEENLQKVANAVVITNDESSETSTNTAKITNDKIYDEISGEFNSNGEILGNINKVVAAANHSASDMAALGLMSWRAEMNDMNKRMGELRNANGEHGVWVRMVRGEDEYKSVKNQYNTYQLGYDEKLSVDKRWTVGAAVSYTDGETSFAKGSGENTNKAFSVYGSKLNADGTFIDLIAKYARLENEFKTATGMGDADYSTNGYSVSAEFGKRIQQGNGLWVEPQVELTYGKVSSVDYLSKAGVKVAQDGMESIVGRVGFSLGKDIKQGNVYARASYLYDFDGETSVSLDGKETLEQDLGGGWWEVGVGTNINLSKATYIYADVEKTFGGEVDTNWQWNLGVRYSF